MMMMEVLNTHDAPKSRNRKLNKCSNTKFRCDFYIFLVILSVIALACISSFIIYTLNNDHNLFTRTEGFSTFETKREGQTICNESCKIYLKNDLKPEPPRNKNLVLQRKVINDYIKSSEKSFAEDRQHVKSMMPTAGTNDMVFYGQDGIGHDWGFFSAVLQSYSNHWVLKTVPDDWWITVVKTVGTAIDENSKNKKIGKFFVNHEGKKTLTVEWNRNFSSLYTEMASQIQSNIKINGFVNTITSDFSTSEIKHQIVSQIMVMSSMQEYFEYVMSIACDIPSIEFVGTKEDYKNLKVKLGKLEQLLKPIVKEIGLEGYFEEVSVVFDKIIDSIYGNVDVEWWNNIFNVTYPPSSRYIGRRRKKRSIWNKRKLLTIENTCSVEEADRFDGWFISLLLNKKGGVSSLSELPSGLVSVPLIINNTMLDIGHISNASIVAGIAGMKIDDSEDIPVVEAAHGWALFEPSDEVPEELDYNSYHYSNY